MDQTSHISIANLGTGKISEALAKAQAAIPTPKKTREVDFTYQNVRTHYFYADLSDIVDCARKPLSDNGLSYTHLLEYDARGKYGMRTIMFHSSGESISSWHPLPDPALGAKPQAFGSALTYARRYSLSAILGIASDEDDDGAAAQRAAALAAEAESRNAQQNNSQNRNQRNNAPAPSGKPSPIGNSKPQQNQQNNNWTAPEVEEPPKRPVGSAKPVNADFVKLGGFAHSRGWTRDQCVQMMQSLFNIQTSDLLNREQFNILWDTIDSGSYEDAIAKLKLQWPQ